MTGWVKRETKHTTEKVKLGRNENETKALGTGPLGNRETNPVFKQITCSDSTVETFLQQQCRW